MTQEDSAEERAYGSSQHMMAKLTWGKPMNKTMGKFVVYRLLLPYGMWTNADGTQTLFNREYQPIARRLNLDIEGVKRSEWVQHVSQEYLYNDSNPPWKTAKTLTLCLEKLFEFTG